jgi:hypothetical protein
MDDENVVKVHMTTLSYQYETIGKIAHILAAASQKKCQYQDIC